MQPPPFTASAAEPATQPDKGSAKTVVCFGDSLTKIGFGDVLGEEVPATVINAGVSGETTAAALKRLERDVLDRHPDVVTVLFGTNDMVMDKPEPKVAVAAFTANLTTIIQRIRAAGGRPVLCTVPPIDPTPYFTRHPKANYDKVGGLEKVVANYRAAAMSVADAEHVPLVDLNSVLADHPEWRSADGVHPSPQGRRMIAQAIAPVVRDQLDGPKAN